MKFAHLSDIHLGFQKSENLQRTERSVFERAMDECIRRKVDFILIAGDLFHVNIPEMRVQKAAFAKFRQVYEAGIPVYAVYGSHDFSPVSNSVIDLLNETRYLTKVTNVVETGDDRISLEFTVDKKTGAKITGLPGLKAGKDSVYYEKLDRAALEREGGFKIFLFHGGIDEMKTEVGPETDFMALSSLPRGFDYYAGGHMHKYHHARYPDHPNVVYPGTLFAGYHSDLEENARGQERGMVFVEVGQDGLTVEFVPLPNAEYTLIDIDAERKRASTVNSELLEKVRQSDSKDKIVVIKIHGELSEGKTTDIEYAKAKEGLYGALEIKVNRSRLTSREYAITPAGGRDRTEIETNAFRENIGEVRMDERELMGDAGINTARAMLSAAILPILQNEKRTDYQNRIIENMLGTAGLKIRDVARID